MRNKRYAGINIKVLVILIIIAAALITSLFAARQIRRNILSRMDLEAGLIAYESQDWEQAYINFQEYLGRNPDDQEIIKKYAESRLAVRPLKAEDVTAAISAYRRILQLNPQDEAIYRQLSALYISVENYEELAYIARTKLEYFPDDKDAPLWLVQAYINLSKLSDALQTLTDFMEKIESLPEKYTQYVQACQYMSELITTENTSAEAAAEALDWLNKAVNYDSTSAEALVNRAAFYCNTTGITGLNRAEQIAAARADLDAVIEMKTDNPQILLTTTTLWMKLGELDKAASELLSVDTLSQETIESNFMDVQGITIARFLLASELAVRENNLEQAVTMADEVLQTLTEDRHRLQVLPAVISIYAITGKASQAREQLGEYLDVLSTQNLPQVSSFQTTNLRAVVAQAENKPYDVINLLQPAAVNNASSPQLWRLLAESYIQTSQPRLAVDALVKFLSFYPQNVQGYIQLAQQYLTLGNWNSVLTAANRAESIDPENLSAKLLRIQAAINIIASQADVIDTEQFSELSNELQQLYEQYPENLNIRLLQVSITDYLNQPQEVERQLQLAIEQCSETLQAELKLTDYYYQNNQPTEAINVCEAACRRHPDVAQPWMYLSDLYVARNEYDMARSCISQGLSTITSEQQKRLLSIRLATLELINGDRTAGINILNELAEQDNRDVNVRLLLLGIKEIQDDSALTDKLIAELKEIEGQSGRWWRLYQANQWLSSSQWRSRERDITELLQYCITTDPQWTTPTLYLIALYEKLGDTQSIENTARQGLVRNPSAIEIANKLLLLLEQQGRFTEAESILRQLQVNFKASNTWQVRLAIDTGDIAGAIDKLKLRAAGDPQDADARIELARLIYQQTQDTDQAFAYLNEAEAINPDSVSITGVKATILKAQGRTDEALQAINDYVADHNTPASYSMRASYLVEDGQYESAEADYKKLTTFPETGITAYQLLSSFYISTEQNAQALSTIEQGLEIYPEDISLQITQIQILSNSGSEQDLQKAFELLTALEQKNPDNTRLMKLRAALLLKEPTSLSRESARTIMENVISLEPTAIDAQLALIGLAMQNEDYSTARDYAIKALGVNQGNVYLLIARAQAELSLGNNQMASELANLAIQKDKTNTDAIDILVKSALAIASASALNNARTTIESAMSSINDSDKLITAHATVLSALNLQSEAITELETYCRTEQGSKSITACVTLAELYRLAGDTENQRLQVERAETLAPANEAVIYSKMLLLLEQNRPDELNQISSQYLSAENQSQEILTKAGLILLSQDSQQLQQESIKLFEKVVSLSPGSFGANITLASAVYQAGDAARAEQLYRQLLEKYPDNIQVLNDLAWILQEKPDGQQEALELAEKGLGLSPTDLHLLDTRGTILSNIPDRLEDAVKDFQQIVSLSTTDTKQKARALLQLGRIYVKLGDTAAAKDSLQKALETDQNVNTFTAAEKTEIEEIIRQ